MRLSERFAIRLAYEIQAEALLAINSVDEPHAGSYKAVRDLDVVKIATKLHDKVKK